MATMKIKKQNGKSERMTYEDVCWKLGMCCGCNFVAIEKNGTISWTRGTRNELINLYNSVVRNGFCLSDKLNKAVEFVREEDTGDKLLTPADF